MELPEAPRLRSLMAKHGPEIKKLLRERIGCPIVLDEGANCPRCTFRAQGQRGPIPIREGVHLLLNDIRGRADASGKERGKFENRDTDFLISVTGRPSPRRILDDMPPRCLLR